MGPANGRSSPARAGAWCVGKVSINKQKFPFTAGVHSAAVVVGSLSPHKLHQSEHNLRKPFINAYEIDENVNEKKNIRIIFNNRGDK